MVQLTNVTETVIQNLKFVIVCCKDDTCTSAKHNSFWYKNTYNFNLTSEWTHNEVARQYPWVVVGSLFKLSLHNVRHC